MVLAVEVDAGQDRQVSHAHAVRRGADLVVLDGDPSTDIRNSEKIAKVMIGGRLYDAATLNEEITGARKRKPYFWEQSGGSQSASALPGADFRNAD